MVDLFFQNQKIIQKFIDTTDHRGKGYIIRKQSVIERKVRPGHYLNVLDFSLNRRPLLFTLSKTLNTSNKALHTSKPSSKYLYILWVTDDG